VPYEVTNLSGGAATTGSQFQLFSSLGPTLDNSVFDTRTAYDSSTGRFVLIANNLQPGGTATNIDIAISKDSNPADGWFVGSIDTSNGGTTQSDMPCLSVSGGNICITAPEFSGSPLVGSSEWVVSESSIASGSPQILASATTPAADAIMRNVSANGVTYYVSAQSNASQTQLTYQTYSAASGFSAPQTLMLGNSDKGPIGGDYAAQQAGTSLTLDAGDARIESLAYANGYLYGVSETLPTGASAPEIHWFKLDVSNPASPQLVIQGDLSGSLLGDPNIALFNASIAVDGRGDVLINFTASGPNMDPSDYYVVQGAQDSSFGTPTLYQASTSYFQQTPGATGLQRWGTYSSAVADPASQDGFWISNEYVTSTGVTIPSGLSAWWDTVVTNVQVAPYVPILGGAGTTATFTQGGAAAPLDPRIDGQRRRQRDSRRRDNRDQRRPACGRCAQFQQSGWHRRELRRGDWRSDAKRHSKSGGVPDGARIDHLFVGQRGRERCRRRPLPYDHLDGDGRRADLNADHDQRGHRRHLQRGRFVLGNLRSYQLSAAERASGGAAIHRHRREFTLRGDQPHRRCGDHGIPLFTVQLAWDDARQFDL
jgi:hypothetical protein